MKLPLVKIYGMCSRFSISSLGIVFIALLFLWFSPDRVEAEEKTAPVSVVLELFSSQGCPSSPPADALLRTLSTSEGVLALTWPVDYWDRLGWKDTLAHASHARRQLVYNKYLGKSGLMTPQLVINGGLSMNGSRKSKVMDAVRLHLDKEKLALHPRLMVTKGQVQVQMPAMMPKGEDGPYFVRLVYYRDQALVDVKAGQNKGRTLHYKNIVRGSPDPLEWKGAAESLTFPMPAKIGGATHVAVIVQKAFNAGPIIGAATLALPTPSN